jgi:hypothetical protein
MYTRYTAFITRLYGHLQLGITWPNQYSTQGFSALGSTLSNRDSDSGSTRTRPATSYKKIGKVYLAICFCFSLIFLTATSYKKIGEKVIKLYVSDFHHQFFTSNHFR